jgi:hypothetical protein
VPSGCFPSSLFKERMIIKKTAMSQTHLDYEGDEFKVRTFENLTPLLKFNYEMRKDEKQQNGFSSDRDLRWIGRIPQALFIQHWRENPEARDPNGTYWADFLRKSENEPFRTVPKIVGGKTKYI